MNQKQKKDILYKKTFNRNIGILTEEEQEILRNSTLAVGSSLFQVGSLKSSLPAMR